MSDRVTATSRGFESGQSSTASDGIVPNATRNGGSGSSVDCRFAAAATGHRPPPSPAPQSVIVRCATLPSEVASRELYAPTAMQFQFNADYPGVDGATGQPYAPSATNPPPFPAAQPIPCVRITTRVFHRQQIVTVQNVLVPTRRHVVSLDDDDDSMGSSSSSEYGGPADDPPSTLPERAYWIQRTVREAIYGRVLFAVVLTKIGGSDHWVVTDQHCAVKEMSWQHIRQERDRLAEDPVKEVAAMQFLRDWHAQHRPSNSTDAVSQSFQAILDTNIMMPLDLLSDDRHLYSVMPFCDGGELFERLDMNERFSEEEARYWMHQILNVRDESRPRPVGGSSTHHLFRASRIYRMRAFVIAI